MARFNRAGLFLLMGLLSDLKDKLKAHLEGLNHDTVSSESSNEVTMKVLACRRGYTSFQPGMFRRNCHHCNSSFSIGATSSVDSLSECQGCSSCDKPVCQACSTVELQGNAIEKICPDCTKAGVRWNLRLKGVSRPRNLKVSYCHDCETWCRDIDTLGIRNCRVCNRKVCSSCSPGSDPVLCSECKPGYLLTLREMEQLRGSCHICGLYSYNPAKATNGEETFDLASLVFCIGKPEIPLSFCPLCNKDVCFNCTESKKVDSRYQRVCRGH